MKKVFLGAFTSIASLGAAGSAMAGPPGWQPPPINWTSPITSVPVDSPWAIAGLGAVIAVIAARIFINRRK